MITAEEHQIGGLGNLVAGVICREPKLAGKNPPIGMIGVPDRFGESGKSWQLIKEFELAAEFIAQKAAGLLKR